MAQERASWSRWKWKLAHKGRIQQQPCMLVCDCSVLPPTEHVSSVFVIIAVCFNRVCLSGLVANPLARCTLLAVTSESWVRIWTRARKVYQLRNVHAMGLNSQTGTHRGFTCVLFNLWQVAAIKFRGIYCCLRCRVETDVAKLHRWRWAVGLAC